MRPVLKVPKYSRGGSFVARRAHSAYLYANLHCRYFKLGLLNSTYLNTGVVVFDYPCPFLLPLVLVWSLKQ